MTVDLHYAEEHLDELIDLAEKDEEVTITSVGQSSVKLVLVPGPADQPFKRKTPRILGEGVGEIIVPSWEEWQAMDQQLADEIDNAPLISSGDDTAPPDDPTRRPRRELLKEWEGAGESVDQAKWDEIHEEFLATLPDSFKLPDDPA